MRMEKTQMKIVNQRKANFGNQLKIDELIKEQGSNSGYLPEKNKSNSKSIFNTVEYSPFPLI